MDKVLIIILLLALSFLIYILFLQVQKQKKPKLKNQLDHSLVEQLLTMLNGDQQAALRLLRNARKNNPGKSYLWYHEKVIRDLQRDRRY